MITPTSWTDTGLIWTAVNPLWPLQELNLAMIEAVKEKDSATSRTVPALLSATYNPIRPNWDYVNAIHSEVSALIPLFVNHLLPTATPGNYNGETTIPMFTEATILAAIGDSARMVPTHLSTLSAWYFQTKKILDLLRWVKKTVPFSSITGDRKKLIAEWPPGGYPANTDFDDVFSKAQAAEVESNGFVLYFGSIGTYSEQFTDSTYTVILDRNKGKFYFNYFIADLSASIDVYSIPSHITYRGKTNLFDTGSGWTESVLNLIQTISETSLNSPFAGNFIVPTQTPKHQALDTIWTSVLGEGQAVLKFDTPNGFKFKNW